MSIDFTITNLDVLSANLKRKSATVLNSLRQGMKDGMNTFQSKFIAEQLTGRPGLMPGTGDFRRSWEVIAEGDCVRMITSSRYFRPHQEGMIIHKKDKMLTIPANDETRGHPASEFNLKYVQFGKNGPKALIENIAISGSHSRRGKDLSGIGGKQQARVMYWLKDSVDIPKRLMLYESFARDGKEIIMDAMRKILARLAT